MKRLFCVIMLAQSVIISFASGHHDNGSVIKGRVTDTAGNPLAGTAITIEGTYYGVYAAPDGSYSFTNLTDGTYSLRFSFTGYETQTHEVHLYGEYILDVVLEQLSFMTGDVVIKATRAGGGYPCTTGIYKCQQGDYQATKYRSGSALSSQSHPISC